MLALTRAVMSALLTWPLVVYAATQHWVVTESKDAMTDEFSRMASVTNKDGFKFSVYTVGPRDIWANFRIPGSDTAVLDRQKLIVYRVDDYPPRTLETNRFAHEELHLQLLDAQPKWVNWAVGARGSADLQETLRQLQAGKRLIVRFYLFTGGSRDTEFPLAGAREALADVAGVPPTWDAAEEERAKERQKRRPLIPAARERAYQRCLTVPSVLGPEGEPRRRCLNEMSDCARKYGDNVDPISTDATALIACFDAVHPIPLDNPMVLLLPVWSGVGPSVTISAFTTP